MGQQVVLLLLLVGAAMGLAIYRAALWQWAVGLGLVLTFGGLIADGQIWLGGFVGWLGLASVIAVAIMAVPQFRRRFLTRPIFSQLQASVPNVSETEQQALDAGTIGFDAELFSGSPDWDKLRSIQPLILSADERAFLDGPTEELCRLIDEWNVRHTERGIPENIWAIVKDRGFLGMFISKAHGGLGFSVQAQSLILGKIASRSPDVAIVVMVPNSLGPGELVERYGSDAQKAHYLPKLARGEDIPCFALTGPHSGSDAASMRDAGVVARGMHEGKETLGVRLSWDKRYITLAPVATLIGLAFYLRDPDNLLGPDKDPGITLALIPSDHPGVNIGRRHLPCGSVFPNGPTSGRDVFIPIDWIIGGRDRAGDGWRMLLECLSAGRAISLPSLATAGIKTLLRRSLAYGLVRRQFGLSIARMEGVEEPLSRLIEQAYVTEAARVMTASLVGRGERPAVISAFMKYQMTERMRRAVNDTFDIHGGRAICDGPSNYLQGAYQMVPIGITVEGANILTRTLITFSQGALRSHPYLYQEVKAIQAGDEGFSDFEAAFQSHASFTAAAGASALFHNLTFGLLARAPEGVRPGARQVRRFYRMISHASANFAFVADLVVVTLGGKLKVKQKLSGRLADALSELYFAAAAVKRFEDDGWKPDELALLEMAVLNGLNRFETALAGVVENFPSALGRVFLRILIFPFGSQHKAASDRHCSSVVAAVLRSRDMWDRLTRDTFVSRSADDPAGLLEVAVEKVLAAEDAEKKLERAVRSGVVGRYHGLDWIGRAAEVGVLTESEAQLVRDAETYRSRVIAVDDFHSKDELPS